MFRSFRSQVTLLFGLLALLVVTVLAVALGSMMSENMARNQGEALHALARSTSVLLAEGLHERMREVELIAASPDLLRDGIDAPSIGATLTRMQATRPQYAWIGVTDAKGIVRVSTKSMLVGANVRERPWFSHAQAGSYVGDVHPAKLLAKLLPASMTGEPPRFVDFAAPLRGPDGQLVGVLGVHGTWDWAHEVINTLRTDGARDKGIVVFILDQHGKVIHEPTGPEGKIHPPKDNQLAGHHSIATWSDGQRYLTATCPLPARRAVTQLGWTVVVRQPEALALSAAIQARALVQACGGLAATLVMLLTWFAAGRVSEPLASISAAAQRIEAGDLNARIPTTTGSSELQHLSASLRGMTDAMMSSQQALAHVNATLEERVRERTDELERANAELDSLARKDALTDLFNRRAADDRLNEEWARHRRNGKRLSLMMVDIDHFKRINDQHGHPAGDEALRMVAHALARHCRGTDFIARFGGEEFLLLLPETMLAGALQLAEKLRAAVAALQIPAVGAITVSVGVAMAADFEKEAVADLVKAADEALYLAKQSGRNQVATRQGDGDGSMATSPAAHT